MKMIQMFIAALCAVLLASCATSTNYGAGGYSSKGGVRGGGGPQVATSGVEVNLLNVQLGGALVGRPPVRAYGQRYPQQGYRPQQRQPRQCFGPQQGYRPQHPHQQRRGQYQQQRRAYHGHANNPISVGAGPGVIMEFSDQFPAGKPRRY